MKIAMKLVRLLPFAALLFTALSASAESGGPAPAAPVEKLSAYRDGDTFITELQVQGSWSSSDVKTQFSADAVQIDFPNAVLTKGKQLVKVDDRIFKSVYATQTDAGTVRTRFATAQGVSGHSLEEQVRIRRTANGIVVEVAGDPKKIDPKKAKAPEVTRNIAVVEDEGTTEAISTKLVAGSANNEFGAQDEQANAASPAANNQAATLATAKPDAKLPENQIPVLAAVKEVKKTNENPIVRIMITLGVLATVLGGALVGIKRWQAKNINKRQNTRIKILTQHAIGPKKSLAIIQVAGESILVGITDQNISMLKTLSLIDDEVPAEVPQRFDSAMDRLDDEELEDFVSRDLSKIRDTVSSRLKTMRNL